MSTLNPYKADAKTPVGTTTLERSLAEQKKAAADAKAKAAKKSE